MRANAQSSRLTSTGSPAAVQRCGWPSIVRTVMLLAGAAAAIVGTGRRKADSGADQGVPAKGTSPSRVPCRCSARIGPAQRGTSSVPASTPTVSTSAGRAQANR